MLQREPYRTQFVAALNNIIHNSSNSTITTNAIQLLGRFGGRSRSLLHGRISIPCMTSTAEGYVVILNGQRFIMDDVLEITVQLLERNLIAEFFGKYRNQTSFNSPVTLPSTILNDAKCSNCLQANCYSSSGTMYHCSLLSRTDSYRSSGCISLANQLYLEKPMFLSLF